MISSLANFLMLILYRGGQPGRVSWTLLMFTLGAVGIARVAIEKDRAYSLGYAGILGIAAFVTMMKFVDSLIFSILILALIAYLADRIVRDCTLINDDVDASGQGLIDSGRLFVREKIKVPDYGNDGEAPENSGAARRRAGHQPGRTVLYLALAALPLFGIGQFFLRDDPATWDRAQKLLAFYLFASLSLLVTTSFLGLRRYLRQRRVDMPRDVSIAWLAGGVALVALILFIAFLAPIPGALLASFELPAFLDSPGDTVASKQGWGEDAADRKSEGAETTSQDTNTAEKEIQETAPGENAPAGDVGTGKKKDGPTGNQKGGDKSPGQSDKSAEKSGGEEKGPQEKSSGTPEGEGKQESASDSQSTKDQDSQSRQDEAKEEQSSEPTPSQPPKSESPKNEPAPQGQSESSSTAQPAESSSSNALQSVAQQLPGLSSLLKLVILIALSGIVAWFVWIHRHAIGLWWSQLFSTTALSSENNLDEFLSADSRVPQRAFASFSNPIGREPDNRRVIVITFAAWEAWCREQGVSRTREETPSEFLRRTTSLPSHSPQAASRMVDAYNRIVYGRGNAVDTDVAAAKDLWNSMQSR